MKIYAYMECGLNKVHSEDTMLINGKELKEGFFSFDIPGNCIAIADGVGGNAGGQEASEFVLSHLKSSISGDTEKSITHINN